MKEKKERNKGSFRRILPNGRIISFKYQEELDEYCAYMSRCRFPTILGMYQSIDKYLKRAR